MSLFKKGHNILFPRVIDEHNMEAAVIHDPEWDFVKGAFGIPEPKTEVFEGDIDLILVPGVVFDEQGHRIGYGKGYYDRFLQDRQTLSIGVSFRFQVIPRLPFTGHDVRLKGLVTQDGYNKFK